MGKSLPKELAEVALALGMFAEGPSRTQQGDRGWVVGVSARPCGKSERGFEAIDSQLPLVLRRFFPQGAGLVAVMCHLPGFGISLFLV